MWYYYHVSKKENLQFVLLQFGAGRIWRFEMSTNLKCSFDVRVDKGAKPLAIDLGTIDLDKVIENPNVNIPKLALASFIISCQSHIRQAQPKNQAEAIALAKAYKLNPGAGGRKKSVSEKLADTLAKAGWDESQIKEAVANLDRTAAKRTV